MKLLVDIKDSKAEFIIELLKSFSYVKTKTLTPYKAQVLEELKEAVDNMNLVNEGKLKARPAKDLLNEL
jgi:hypothetical protein